MEIIYFFPPFFFHRILNIIIMRPLYLCLRRDANKKFYNFIRFNKFDILKHLILIFNEQFNLE